MEFRRVLFRSVREALIMLDELASDAILFVVNADNKLLGSLTDGDLRRGFIRGLNFESEITEFIQPNPKFIVEHNYALGVLEELKRQDFKVIPILNTDNVIIDILDRKSTRLNSSH